MQTLEHQNWVNPRLVPLVRPLGNLVILYARTEAALLELATVLKDEQEEEGLNLFNKRDQLQRIKVLIEKLQIEDFIFTEICEHLDKYQETREKRNRLIHDEWYVGLYPEDDQIAVPSTRGWFREKNAAVVYDEPTPEKIWQLVREFHEHRQVFGTATLALRNRRRRARAQPA